MLTFSWCYFGQEEAVMDQRVWLGHFIWLLLFLFSPGACHTVNKNKNLYLSWVIFSDFYNLKFFSLYLKLKPQYISLPIYVIGQHKVKRKQHVDYKIFTQKWNSVFFNPFYNGVPNWNQDQIVLRSHLFRTKSYLVCDLISESSNNSINTKEHSRYSRSGRKLWRSLHGNMVVVSWCYGTNFFSWSRYVGQNWWEDEWS